MAKGEVINFLTCEDMKRDDIDKHIINIVVLDFAFT